MHTREQIIKDYLGKLVHVEVDRPIGYLHGGIVYPVNYGYIPGTMAPDGEAQDAYILGVDVPIEEFYGQVIGAIRRKNDVEDKLIAGPPGAKYTAEEMAAAIHFQEQYYDTYIEAFEGE